MDIKADIKADIETEDRGEFISLMEPLIISEHARQRGEIVDLAVELAQKSTGLRRSLPENLLSSLATLLRAMNCYYSNLIEGHDTHPVDIEKALLQEYSADDHQRNLQLEARAHIAVQTWIDQGGLIGCALTVEGLQNIHRRFCDDLPENLLWVENPVLRKRLPVVAGKWRSHDVKVGSHIAISPGAVPRFMNRFEKSYHGLGRTSSILAAACAHHRLLWIHPFIDGNGRVARLMSHAILLETLDTGAIWSIARGLARNVDSYKSHLAACDLTRRNDLDGRGNLSEETFANFTVFFLKICIDQVDFMESLIQPERLRTRIQLWAEESIRLNVLPPKADAVLKALLYRGELQRAEIPAIVGTGERQARRIVAALIAEGVVVSKTSRAPLCLAFPALIAYRWMPGLFPEKIGN